MTLSFSAGIRLLLSGFLHSAFHIIVFYHKTRKNSRGDNKICARLPRAAKGFNLVCARLLFGALIRGSQNLGAFCEGVRVVTFCVVQKVTKKHAGRSPATHDSKLCRKRFCRKFRRHVSKPVLPAKRRRKGFESVRKGYRSADARLMFCENEKVYCKLTVGCCR